MLSRFFLLALTIFSISLIAQKETSVFDIPVFVYHRFGDNRNPSTDIPAETFEKQLKFLSENHYHVIPFGKAVEKWMNGVPIPDSTVILTIDDGYLSFYENALPLLKKYGFTATVFVQTETVGGNDFMNWDQLNRIRQAGIEIGNHSAEHFHFVDAGPEMVRHVFAEDLQKAALAFKAHLGISPVIYAYPYGEWTPAMAEVLRQNGIVAAAAQNSGVFCESSNAYAVPRFPMGGRFATMEGFKEKIRMKALRVVETSPASPVVENNPPSLVLKINSAGINPHQFQFFVNGIKSENFTVTTGEGLIVLNMQAAAALTSRRTLYTVTVPSTDGKQWNWYSHLWIVRKLDEE
jgi:peptidoglycan/xylan/chitin deacetylase (PgdA/CDA1 family)